MNLSVQNLGEVVESQIHFGEVGLEMKELDNSSSG